MVLTIKYRCILEMTDYYKLDSEFSSELEWTDNKGKETDNRGKDTEERGLPAYMTRVRLMDQGTFGCIYRPEIECDTGNAGDYAYVSKVQKMTKTIENEIEISNEVKQIPHYMFWYSPLLKTCPIYFSTLKKYETCKAVEDSIRTAIPTNKTQFISSKIRYVGKYLIDYLLELPSEICAKKIITTYAYLDTAITRLNKHGIIHNDIKENNVLYDPYNHSPNIIDFGISYKISDLGDETKERKIFYTTKFYPYWCIHIYLLCVVGVADVPSTGPTSSSSTTTSSGPTTSTGTTSTLVLSEEYLVKVYESYVTEFKKFAEETQIIRIITEADLQKHKESYWEYMRPYIGKSWTHDLRPALLKTHLHWDKYSLAIMYMVILSRMHSSSIDPVFVETLRNRFTQLG